VEDAAPRLRRISEADAASPWAPGKWTRKEVIGHLIDSASNNHGRIVRAALQGEVTLPGYAQDEWVRLQDHAGAEWALLVNLWRAYNLHLARVIARVPADKASAVCRIGDNEPLTLGALAEDYLRHLEHHLAQVGSGSPGR
jgi:hypothetical protein